jgi:hypothetical protein
VPALTVIIEYKSREVGKVVIDANFNRSADVERIRAAVKDEIARLGYRPSQCTAYVPGVVQGQRTAISLR